MRKLLRKVIFASGTEEIVSPLGKNQRFAITS